MFKNYAVNLGLWISQRFFLFLFGGAPPVQNKEEFRNWCLKNHRWIVLIAKRTTNTYDDAASNILLAILQTPALFDLFWDAVTKNQPLIDSNSDTNPDTEKEPGFLRRLFSAIRLRGSESETSVSSAVSILSFISNFRKIGN